MWIITNILVPSKIWEGKTSIMLCSIRKKLKNKGPLDAVNDIGKVKQEQQLTKMVIRLD